jgi:hypothetical protein
MCLAASTTTNCGKIETAMILPRGSDSPGASLFEFRTDEILEGEHLVPTTGDGRMLTFRKRDFNANSRP